MMAFTTHCCTKIKFSSLRIVRVCGLLVSFLIVMAVPLLASAQENEAEVTQLKLQRSDEGIFLTANLKFELSTTVQDALLKGVPIYFLAELSILKERWYWLDAVQLKAQRAYRLAYQPLTRRWRLTVANVAPGKSLADANAAAAALSQSFDGLPEALRAIQYLAQWRVAQASEIEPGLQGRLEFAFRLDWNQLPRSFQIGSMGRNDWRVSIQRNQRLQLERLP
jgi:Domain of unknown function (DUF4390)